MLPITELDSPSSCFIQIAYDELKRILFVELPDFELISNPFIRLANVIYLQSLTAELQIPPRFISVVKYANNKTLLFHNIESHLKTHWPGKDLSKFKNDEDHLLCIFVFEDQNDKELIGSVYSNIKDWFPN